MTYIRGHPSNSWLPQKQGEGDFAIMVFATNNFSKEKSILINRCWIYLKVINAFDVFMIERSHIHPDPMNKVPVQSNRATLHGSMQTNPPIDTGLYENAL